MIIINMELIYLLPGAAGYLKLRVMARQLLFVSM